MTILDQLKSLLGWPGRTVRPLSRLTEDEARAIASKSLGGELSLVVHDVIVTERGVEWRIGTATMSSGEVVFIDDATGAVLRIEPWGV